MPQCAVYCDFDGTITQGDVTDALLEELADPGWRAIESEWAEGLIGSRECLARQVALIRGGWAAMARTIERITVDPTFPAFAAWCRARGVALRIVSDGFDRVIHTLLAREGVAVDAVFANRLIESPNGPLSLDFPMPPTDRSCSAGLCKCRVLEENTSTLQVVIGDGRSDWCWAQRADLLFAKSELLSYCFLNRIPCQPFDNFDAIRHTLERIRTTIGHAKKLVS